MLKSWHELQADSSERLDDIPWLAPRAKIGPGNNPITVDANGQFESTLLFQQGDYPTWKSWDLTNLTQKWVNTPSSNNGVILWATNEDVNSYDLRFYSSENETKPPELMIIWSDQPKTVYFLKDHLGSIRATVLDSAGAPVVGYSDYDPWGYILENRTKTRTWGDNQAIAENKFTGKERDEEFSLNWDFFGARYYDAEIGRWMSVDPQRNTIVPKSLLRSTDYIVSPFGYTLNNPVRFFDPNGLETRGVDISFLGGSSVAGSAGVTIVTDDKGNAGLLFHTGVGGLFGAVVGGSVGYQETSANTVFDLAGLSFTAGIGLGAGVFGAAEFNSSLDLSYSGKTTSVGLGEGAGAFLTIEESVLVQTGFQEATNVIEHAIKGGKLLVEDGKVFLVDDKGNKTDSGVTLTTGFEQGTTGSKIYEHIMRIFSDDDDKKDNDN